MTDNSVEQIILNEGGVKITNLRAVIGPNTYAISNIASIRLVRKEPSGCVAFSLIVGGLFIVIPSFFAVITDFQGDSWSWLIGGILAVILGFLLHRSARSSFIVQIGSASGEINALSSQDEAYIRRIVNAMNEAIVLRG